MLLLRMVAGGAAEVARICRWGVRNAIPRFEVEQCARLFGFIVTLLLGQIAECWVRCVSHEFAMDA